MEEVIVPGGVCLGHHLGMSGECLGNHSGHVWGFIWGPQTGACLGDHLGHVWGIIWSMSGASYGVCLGIIQREKLKILKI